MSIFRGLFRSFFVISCMTIFVLLLWLFTKYVPWGSSRSLTVCAWGDMFHPAMIRKFERETGITVHMSSFSSNEELLVKMRATQGIGYDVIVLSDYAAGILISEKLLKNIDQSKIKRENIYKNLMGYSWDPDNTYTIPFEWEIFGYGVNTRLMPKPITKPSWQFIFSRPLGGPLVMVNDPLEVLWMARSALDPAGGEWLEKSVKLLRNQKKFVNAYTDTRADYYLMTDNSAVAVASSSYLWRCEQQDPAVWAYFPNDPFFLTIEHFAIPRGTLKDELVYTFISFMLRADVQLFHAEQYAFLPADQGALERILMQHPEHKKIVDEINSSSISFFESIPAHILSFVWMQLKGCA